MSKKPRRKKIKAHRKPKIARDRSWKKRILEGEIDDIDELDLPETERILPPSREEERVNVRRKVDDEIRSAAQEPAQEGTESALEHCQPGTVTRISTSIYHVDLGEETLLCSVRGTLSASYSGYTNVVAVGDRVLVSREGTESGVIEQVGPRQTVLARPDPFNDDLSQVVVANVDQLLIVVAWEPALMWLELIDRYLIAAAEGNLTPIICLNKVDLASRLRTCKKVMSIYERLGYTVLYTSAVTGRGMRRLRNQLVNRSTVLAGLSGVGKSSLLNVIQPNLELRIADVSEDSGQGRHTTTQVSLLRLDRGGYVVDTPGIRELGLITTHRPELVLHFPEIAALIDQCRFNDCTHIHEPGCAVIEAVDREEIPWSRYESYQSIYESLPEYYTE